MPNLSTPTAATPAPDSPTLATSTDELLTVEDVAKILKCDVNAIYNLTRKRSQARSENPIPAIHLQVGLRFSKAEIWEWLRNQRLAERAKQRAATHKEAA